LQAKAKRLAEWSEISTRHFGVRHAHGIVRKFPEDSHSGPEIHLIRIFYPVRAIEDFVKKLECLDPHSIR
jgi:hypothetical protein